MNKCLAIFLHALYGGGAERAMFNLACGFAQQGVSVDMVLLRAEGTYLTQLPATVRVINLGGGKLWQCFPALVRYLQQEQPEIMLSTLDDTNIAALLARRLAGGPTHLVVNVQNTISEDAKNAVELKTRVMPQLVRWFFPWADAVVPVSEGVAADLVQMGVAPALIRVIHNPVISPNVFLKAQEPVDHPWFTQDQPPVILGVGRLNQQKDFGTLIRAFAQLRQQRPAKLMILGEGDEHHTLSTLIQDLALSADVDLPGFVPNPYAYMARAAVFVLSSLYEGLPSVLIEAMAAGASVVATNCQSGPAEILAQGQFGRLVPIQDVAAMATAIAAAIDQPTPREILKQQALKFSLEQALAQYAEVLTLNESCADGLNH
jgi:glycosyltransferase involved in cell wall biosynthesis